MRTHVRGLSYIVLAHCPTTEYCPSAPNQAFPEPLTVSLVTLSFKAVDFPSDDLEAHSGLSF